MRFRVRQRSELSDLFKWQLDTPRCPVIPTAQRVTASSDGCPQVKERLAPALEKPSTPHEAHPLTQLFGSFCLARDRNLLLLYHKLPWTSGNRRLWLLHDCVSSLTRPPRLCLPSKLLDRISAALPDHLIALSPYTEL